MFLDPKYGGRGQKSLQFAQQPEISDQRPEVRWDLVILKGFDRYEDPKRGSAHSVTSLL